MSGGGGTIIWNWRAHMEREIKRKPTLFLIKQCWSPRYKVPVLYTFEGCQPERFIVRSFYNLKYIANNHDNNYKNNDTNNKLSS